MGLIKFGEILAKALVLKQVKQNTEEHFETIMLILNGLGRNYTMRIHNEVIL